MNDSDILRSGQTFTFTYDSGAFFNFDSDTEVLNFLASYMSAFGTVQKVTRPLFSGRYVITVASSSNYTLYDWKNGLDAAFDANGFNDNAFVAVEGGTSSSEGGGISQIITDTAGGIATTTADTIGAVIKPLAPYLLAALAVSIVFISVYGKAKKEIF
jgi:hypothetical protein